MAGQNLVEKSGHFDLHSMSTLKWPERIGRSALFGGDTEWSGTKNCASFLRLK
jgi:hypothetical protein